jgi:hypothetical protein
MFSTQTNILLTRQKEMRKRGKQRKRCKILFKIVESITSLLTLIWNRHGHECSIFASQGLRFGSPFSPPLADLEYILRIRALKFHWLRLPVHVSNQKTFYTEHMLSTKCKQKGTGMLSYDNDLPLPVLVPMKTSFPSAKALKLSLG